MHLRPNPQPRTLLALLIAILCCTPIGAQAAAPAVRDAVDALTGADGDASSPPPTAPKVSQEEAGEAVSGVESASVADLRIALLPMRRADLEAQLELWTARLQTRVAELAEAELALTSAVGDRGALNARANQLREERRRTADRLDAVIAEADRKGVDIEEYEQYLDAVTEFRTSTDVRAAADAVGAWLVSPTGGIRWGLKILSFLLILAGAWVLSRVVNKVIARALRNVTNASDLLRDFLATIASQLTLIIGIVVALGQLGVEVGPFLAAIGAAGFIIGFALQGTLSNFAAGVMILMYRPFDVGDAVEVAGVSGTVRSMTLVSTTILTFDNQTIIVPNNSIWGNVIKNSTGQATRRVDLKFTIAYGNDEDKARSILESIVRSHPAVLREPEPVVRVHELSNTTITLICRPWVKTEDYWSVYWDLTREVKHRFDAAGISIPLPKQDVHVYLQAPQPGGDGPRGPLPRQA